MKIQSFQYVLDTRLRGYDEQTEFINRMIVLGFYILWQTIFLRWAVPSLIFGGALLLFGLFRIRMIQGYFHQKGKKDGT